MSDEDIEILKKQINELSCLMAYCTRPYPETIERLEELKNRLREKGGKI